MKAFREAVEARDVAALEDFRYTRTIGEAGSADHVLVFEARVGDRQIEGADFLPRAPAVVRLRW